MTLEQPPQDNFLECLPAGPSQSEFQDKSSSGFFGSGGSNFLDPALTENPHCNLTQTIDWIELIDEPTLDSERLSPLRDMLIPGFDCLAQPPHFHAENSKGKSREDALKESQDNFCGICFHHDEAEGGCDFDL